MRFKSELKLLSMSPKTTIDKTKSAIVDKVDTGTHTIMEITI